MNRGLETEQNQAEKRVQVQIKQTTQALNRDL